MPGFTNLQFPHRDFQKFFSLLSFDFHCVESVQIRSFFWSIFSRIRSEYGEIRSMRENTDQIKLCIWTLFTQCSKIYLQKYLIYFCLKFITISSLFGTTPLIIDQVGGTGCSWFGIQPLIVDLTDDTSLSGWFGDR